MTERMKAWSRPSREFAIQETRRRLHTLVEQLDRISGSADVDTVHDLRVSIRRFSQSVRIFGTLLPKKARKVPKQLKVVMDAAATARDLDVGMEMLVSDSVLSDDPFMVQLQAERRRAELQLVGHACLLKADDFGAEWDRLLSD